MHEIRSPRRYRKPKCARCEIDSTGFERSETRRRRPSDRPDYFHSLETILIYAYNVIALNHPIIRGKRFPTMPLSCMRYTTPFSTLAPRKGSLIIPRFQIPPPSLSLSVRHLTGTTYIVFDRLGHRVANRKVRKERFVIYVAFFPSSLPFGDSW